MSVGGQPLADAVEHRSRRALGAAGGHLRTRALKLLAYLLLAYLVLKLIPSLKDALSSLEHVSWTWLVGAALIETLSEMGFVVSWRAIVDPDDVLGGEGRSRRIDVRAAWTQLGGGMLLPGGALGGVGVGAWILRHFGMPAKLIAERQFNLSFLNTAVDGLALVFFGTGLAIGVFAGEGNLLLTLLPAALAAAALVGARLVAHGASSYAARLQPKHPRVAGAITALAAAVADTERNLFHRGDWTSAIGAVAYLGFDTLVLYSAFFAIHAHPVPGYPIVIMAYIVGALGGSIPGLPAGVGSVGGMAGMLILYGVGHDAAIAAVVLYEAVGLLVPLVGGGIAYVLLRRQFGPMPAGAADQSASAPT